MNQASEPAEPSPPSRRTVVMDLSPAPAASAAPPAPAPAASAWDRKLARLEAQRAKVAAERELVRGEREAAVWDADMALVNGRARVLGASSAASQAEDFVCYYRARVADAERQLAVVRAKLAESEAAAATAREWVVEAQAAVPPLEIERARAGAPFDRHYAALADELRRLDYRIEQHRARGPGAEALFIGAREGEAEDQALPGPGHRQSGPPLWLPRGAPPRGFEAR